MNTLDQQLADLCRIHGLTSISLTAYNAHREFVGCNVQGGGFVGSDLAKEGDTFADCFKAALLDLRAKQAAGAVVPDVTFAPIGEAA